MSETRATDEKAIRAFLGDVVFDMMPSGGFEGALGALPEGATIAVTLVPDMGIWPTVERTETAAARGFDVVPHVAARFIEDRAELADVATRLEAAGVTDIFVPGGDRDEPVGEFSSAYELLVAIEELGHDFAEVGIAGYPTGHEVIDDATLAEAMANKAPHATYIATQLTLDPTAIVEWIEGIRDRGVDLPVEVGIPGVMDYLRLLKLAWEWGVADPLRFVRKTMGIAEFVRTLVGSGGRYTPDEMVDALAPYHDDEWYDFRRTRLYTFNQTDDTEAWRQRYPGA